MKVYYIYCSVSLELCKNLKKQKSYSRLSFCCILEVTIFHDFTSQWPEVTEVCNFGFLSFSCVSVSVVNFMKFWDGHFRDPADLAWNHPVAEHWDLPNNWDFLVFRYRVCIPKVTIYYITDGRMFFFFSGYVKRDTFSKWSLSSDSLAMASSSLKR
jgi:hypothetical protein